MISSHKLRCNPDLKLIQPMQGYKWNSYLLNISLLKFSSFHVPTGKHNYKTLAFVLMSCFCCIDINMDDVKDTVRETVVAAVADAVKKEVSDGMQLIERKLDSNYYFIVRVV